MDSTDLEAFERRARRRYEWVRVRRAIVGFSPALAIVGAAALNERRPGSATAFGLAMFAVGVMLLWYGRDVRRAVLPGVALGALPLVLALCANHLHSCHGGACMSFCMPACVLGGLGAGIGVGIIGHRARRTAGYWAAVSSLALLTGATGCTCAGYAGVVGLAAGFVVGLAPELIRSVWAKRAR
jgi:hypothetical protein